ncbi:MAG: hypothetical protein NTZ95_01885 [Candidatus Omnitrophica bacterium]|nr:hypothetical protein [Candidatus Omnitrophota bacterium]
MLNNIPGRVEFPSGEDIVKDTKAYNDLFASIDIARIEVEFLKREAARSLVAIKGSLAEDGLSEGAFKLLKDTGIKIAEDPDAKGRYFLVSPAAEIKAFLGKTELDGKDYRIIKRYGLNNSGLNKTKRMRYRITVHRDAKFNLMKVMGPKYRFLRYKQTPTFDLSEEDRTRQSGGTVIGLFGVKVKDRAGRDTSEYEMPGSEKYIGLLERDAVGEIKEDDGGAPHLASELFAHRVGYDLNAAVYCMNIEFLENLKPGEYKTGIKERAARIGAVSEYENILDSLASRIPIRDRYQFVIGAALIISVC